MLLYLSDYLKIFVGLLNFDKMPFIFRLKHYLCKAAGSRLQYLTIFNVRQQYLITQQLITGNSSRK